MDWHCSTCGEHLGPLLFSGIGATMRCPRCGGTSFSSGLLTSAAAAPPTFPAAPVGFGQTVCAAGAPVRLGWGVGISESASGRMASVVTHSVVV